MTISHLCNLQYINLVISETILQGKWLHTKLEHNFTVGLTA